MSIGSILCITYTVVGFILAFYWFSHDYADSYNNAVSNDEEEKGMTSVFILLLILFWPIKFLKNLIMKKHI